MFKWIDMKRKQKELLNLMAKMKMERYYLVDMKEFTNRYRLIIGIYAGGSISEFTKHKEELDNWLGCISRITPIRFTNTFIMDCCTVDVGKYEFKPVKTKPTQLYIGKTFFNENYFIDITKDPHLAIFGMTGSGKSMLLAIVLTNLIYNHSKEIELYLCQTHKRDLDLFKYCSCVKLNCYTSQETKFVLEKALKCIQDRSIKFAELGIKDITQYNRVNGHKMKRKFYIFEEISLYTPSETDNDDEYALKEIVWRLLLNILKLGRSAGIHVIMLSQRSTVSNLGGKNGDVKSNLTKITFYQNSNTNSQNVLDTNDATRLDNLECCVLDTKGITVIKVPYVDEDMTILHKYVPEMHIFGMKTVNNNNVNFKKQVEYVNFSQENTKKTTTNSNKLLKIEQKTQKNDEKQSKIVNNSNNSNKLLKKGVICDE